MNNLGRLLNLRIELIEEIQFANLGHEKIVRILIQNEANLNDKQMNTELTPLHIAASQGSLKIISNVKIFK